MIAREAWDHKDCGCYAREPHIGSEFRWRSIDALTGADRGWKHCTVVEVEPIPTGKALCRRVTLKGEDGKVWKPVLAEFWAKYQAVNNVVAFPARADTEEGGR